MTVGATGSAPEWTGTEVPGAARSKSEKPPASNDISDTKGNFGNHMLESSSQLKSSGTLFKRIQVRNDKKGSPDSENVNQAATVAVLPGMQQKPLPMTLFIGLPQSSTAGDEMGSDSPAVEAPSGATAVTNLSVPNLLLSDNDQASSGTFSPAAASIRPISEAQRTRQTQPLQNNPVPIAMDLLPYTEQQIEESGIEKAVGSAQIDIAAVDAPIPRPDVRIQAPGTLAFALRVTSSELTDGMTEQQQSPVSSSGREAKSSLNSALHLPTSTLAAGAVEAAAGSQLEQNAHSRENLHQAAAPNISMPPPLKAEESTVPNKEAPTASTTPTTESELSSPKAEPVNNVHMQLLSDDNRRVDVRLVDRGGELHVSVKSGDSDPARDLQVHMPELTSRLQQQHLQSEVWMPRGSDRSRAESASDRGFTPDGSGGGNSSSSDQKRRGQQQHKPDWVEALESYS